MLVPASHPGLRIDLRNKIAEKTYLVVAYGLVFAYIYLVVGKFEFVKVSCCARIICLLYLVNPMI